MNKRNIPRIALREQHLPYKWQERLIANQKIGGVFLVFLSGKDMEEINTKVKYLKEFCKTVDGQLEDFAQVKPL